MIQPGQPSPYNMRGLKIPAAPSENSAIPADGVAAAPGAEKVAASSAHGVNSGGVVALMTTEEEKRKLRETLQKIRDLIPQLPPALQSAARAQVDAIVALADGGNVSGALSMSTSLLGACEDGADRQARNKLHDAVVAKAQATQTADNVEKEKLHEQEMLDAKAAFGMDRLTLSIEATTAAAQV
jgi:hypothetical protein